MAVAEVWSREELDEIISGDPALALGSYEVFPMRAVYIRKKAGIS
jgi:hypothetical protein